jgi:hypothetical protein
MKQARDVRGLQRYMLLGQVVSSLMGLMGLCAIGLYFDPKSRRPAVIETEQGLLWAMAGNSANRVQL